MAFTLQAWQPASGIAAYALSGDGGNWTTTAVAGCSVGQVLPCAPALAAAGTWNLPPGPGTKTVWAKVESAAGVWSAPQAASVYVNVDQTVPTVDATLDGGAGSTASTALTVAMTVSDPVAAQNAALTWQTRYSTDGGQSWSGLAARGRSAGVAGLLARPRRGQWGAHGAGQAENNDNNLGQGGASIAYAAPGTEDGASLPGGAGGAGSPCCWTAGGAAIAGTCVSRSEVTVALSPPAAAIQMRSSLDAVTWGPWQAPVSSLALDLGAAPGVKTISGPSIRTPRER